MKRLVVVLTVFFILLPFNGCGCNHEFSVATCVAPATCSKCGETRGEPLGHDWIEATCTEPKTCLQCGVTVGDALGHKAEHEVTCTNGSVCTVCGEVLPALGHKWEDATCIRLKTCSVCGAVEGDYADHVFMDATCLAPKTCQICGVTEGKVSKEHTWIDATCTEAKVCSLCGAKNGKPLGHKYEAATCTKPKTCVRCGHTSGEAKGHKPGQWVVTVQASKGKAGTKVKKCSVCKAVVESQQFYLTDKELLKQYKSSSSYKYTDLARNPNSYTNTKVFFSGKVLQVVSEATSSLGYSEYRVATKGRYDNVVYLYISNYGSNSRILEGDTISFYGRFEGLLTYRTVLGSTLTIPSIEVEVYCPGTVS